MNRPSGSGGAEAAGFLLAVVVLIAAGVFVAGKLGFDVGGLVPDAPATSGERGRDGGGDPPRRGKGKVVIPDAVNKPGVPIAPETMAFLQEVADIYGGTMTASSGSGGVHGARSDHYAGHAADFGMPTNGERHRGPKGDRMMRACLIAAGDPEPKATRISREGGLETRKHDGLRIQCIWKVADHDDHVHIGARPDR